MEFVLSGILFLAYPFKFKLIDWYDLINEMKVHLEWVKTTFVVYYLSIQILWLKKNFKAQLIIQAVKL